MAGATAALRPQDVVAAPRTERVKVFCRLRPLLQRERDGCSLDEYCLQLDRQQQAQPESSGNKSEVNGTMGTAVGLSETRGEGDTSTFLTEKDRIASSMSVIAMAEDAKTLTHHAPGSESKSFVFDASLAETEKQANVYQRVASEIVADVLDGYNGTILAYGQTATGKTYTMLGADDAVAGEHRGIIPRAFEDIFHHAERMRATVKTTVALSYVQIYCERVFDLFSPETAPSSIVIREDAERGVYLDGAASLAVTSVSDCLRLIEMGHHHRAVAATGMNQQSSRSHAVLIARIERKDYAVRTADTSDGASTTVPTQLMRLSTLCLVDLAGSERVKKTNVYGRHVNELRAINLSLSALGNCISALSKQQAQRHIPYRDSKLTRLLQSSLGGNAKTSLIITVSPSPTEAMETLATLQFGQRAMRVAVQAHQHALSVLDYRALYEETQQRLDNSEQSVEELHQELAGQQDAQRVLQDQLLKTQLRLQHLEFECQAAKMRDTEASSSAAQLVDGSSIASDPQRQAQLEHTLAMLVAQHEKDIAQVQKKCEQKVATYEKLAEQAQNEWHELEDELAGEKGNVLASLQELREFKARFFELESETTERIAELLQEDSDRKREHAEERAALTKQIESLAKELSQVKTKLKAADERHQQLQEQVEVEYVPRETIKEMEALYERAISKLQTRVGSLEQRSSSSNQEREQQSHSSSREKTGLPAVRAPQPLQQDTLMKRKAVPKVGRIVPGSRTGSLR